MSVIDIEGLRLNVEQAGDGSPLVLLHGFTGAAAGWAPVIESLGAGFRTIAIDIVGHGASDAPGAVDRYAMRRCVDDLVAAVRSLGHERAHWLGYSMGGRTALQVGVHRPDAVSSLVLEGATPGLDGEGRAARIMSDEEMADGIERDGVPTFVDFWESIALFESQRSMPQAVQDGVRAGRLANSAVGLANSLRGMGAGAQDPVHDQLSAVTVPVLLVAGALDAKFTQIAREMASEMADATVELIADAGHAAHLERPSEFGDLAGAFLRRQVVATA